MSILDKDLTHVSTPPPSRRLTDEQKAVVDSPIVPGTLLKVRAYAGTGKTSTFQAFAEKNYETRMTYLAFNKSVETEAKQRFGSNVLAKTVHAMAYSVVGKRFSPIKGNVQNWMVAKTFRVPIYEATLVCRTLETFLNSAALEVLPVHVEPDHLHRAGPDYQDRVRAITEAVWGAMQNGSHGFDMTHSGYLKLYQLMRPVIPGDVILLDEAQDTNPVTQDIVLNQLNHGKAVLMCGDPYQQIYAWRGAVDAMAQCEGPEFLLTQSFRFPQWIANLANCILGTFFNETVPLKGLPDPDDALTAPTTGTLITRTNSEIFRRVAALVERGSAYHVIGREAYYQLLDQVLDVYHLFSDQRSKVIDRKIARFATYGDLKEYAETTLDIEAMGRCGIVDAYADQIPEIIRLMRQQYTSQTEAPTFVTCHKAKGLEWDHVFIADDFEDLYDEYGHIKTVGPKDSQITKDEVNLLYVAVTRGRRFVKLNNHLQRLCLANLPTV